MPRQEPLAADQPSVSVELIARRIYHLRGEKIMLDSDLAELYQVPTKALKQAVRRNLDRFPGDFMFQLSAEESALRSQIVTLDKGRGRHSKYAPYAFTEHGVAMLSSVLTSKRAVQMNILIIRAFVQIRELLVTNKDLAGRVEKLEAAQREHTSIIGILAEEIDELKVLPEPPKRRIGYKTD
jgi:hypothetical protein